MKVHNHSKRRKQQKDALKILRNPTTREQLVRELLQAKAMRDGLPVQHVEA